METFADLEGKTIVAVYHRTHSKYDDSGYLDLTFSDGTHQNYT